MGFAETGGEIFEEISKGTAAEISKNTVEGAGKLFMQVLFEPKKARRKLGRLSTILFFPQLIRRAYSTFFKDPDFVINWKIKQAVSRIEQESEKVEKTFVTQWANSMYACDLAIERASRPEEIEKVKQRRLELQKETDEKIKKAGSDTEAIRKIRKEHDIQMEIINRDSVEGAKQAKLNKIRELEASGGGTYEEQYQALRDLRDARIRDLVDVGEFVKTLPCGYRAHKMIEARYNNPESPHHNMLRYALAFLITETRFHQRNIFLINQSKNRARDLNKKVREDSIKLEELQKRDMSPYRQKVAQLEQEKASLEKKLFDFREKLKTATDISETRRINSNIQEVNRLLNGGTDRNGNTYTGITDELERISKIVNDHEIAVKKLQTSIDDNKYKALFELGHARLRRREDFKNYVQNKQGFGTSKFTVNAVGNLEGNLINSSSMQQNWLASRGNITVDQNKSFEEQLEFYKNASGILDGIKATNGGVPHRVHISQKESKIPEVKVDFDIPEDVVKATRHHHHHHHHGGGKTKITDPFFDPTPNIKPWREYGPESKEFGTQTKDSEPKVWWDHRPEGKETRSVGVGTPAGSDYTGEKVRKTPAVPGRKKWKTTPIAVTPGIPGRGTVSRNPFGATDSECGRGVTDIVKREGEVSHVFVPSPEKKSEEIYVRHNGKGMKKDAQKKLDNLQKKIEQALKSDKLGESETGLLKDVLGNVVIKKQTLKNTPETDIQSLAVMLFGIDDMLKMFTRGALGVAVPSLREGQNYESHSGGVLD